MTPEASVPGSECYWNFSARASSAQTSEYMKYTVDPIFLLARNDPSIAAGWLVARGGKWYFPSLGLPRPRKDLAMSSSVSFLNVDKKGRATLPEEVRSDLGVQSGDLVLLERTQRGTWELVPAHLVPRDQLWFHHPQMQARIAQAEADFAKGRVARSRGPRQAQAFLDGLKRRRKARK